VNINNSVWLTNWFSTTGSTSVTTGTVTIDADNVTKSPRWRSSKYPAIVVVGIDDQTNLAHWLAVADAASARGIKTSYALDLSAAGVLTADNVTAIQSRIAAGHEVLAHGPVPYGG
jgi:ABC-type uncharacterized transport system ATPase component